MSQFNRNIVTMLQKDITLVRVTFDLLSNAALAALEKTKNFKEAGRQTYCYKALKADGIKPGDKVVVKVGDEFKIVTVVKVGEAIDLHADFDYKPIVQKVDMTRYDALIEQEEQVRNLVLEAETKRQSDEAVKAYESLFPAGTPAREAFDKAVNAAATLTAPSIAHEK